MVWARALVEGFALDFSLKVATEIGPVVVVVTGLYVNNILRSCFRNVVV